MNFHCSIKSFQGFKNLPLFGAACVLLFSPTAQAVEVNILQRPLFLGGNGTPLAMLVMGRDHKLYYEAYNDASDLNQDGEIDVGYKPDLKDYNILTQQYEGPLNYYGYFDSYKCYNYESGLFVPKGKTDDPDNNNKKCTKGAGEWSGDFLNYITTSRMDALRRVLYGGYRKVDDTGKTVLERALIPQDAHSWGKEYKDISNDGYDIRDYTDLDLPFPGTRHLFANVTLKNDAAKLPLLRTLKNTKYRIWNWVAIERPVAGDKCVNQSTNCVEPASTDTTHPADHEEFDALINKFQGQRMGSSTIPDPPDFTLNGRIYCISNECNPYGSDDNYLTVFLGSLNVTSAGNYEFAVDGDAAVEVLIDDTLVVGYYGSHSICGNKTTCRNNHSGSIDLEAGSHNIRFNHEEVSGGDSYVLYWKGPDSAGKWEVIPEKKFDDLSVSTYDRTIPASTMSDKTVRVQVCVGDNDNNDLLEKECKGYPESNPTIYKPTGLLHEYGENDRMAFGLLTGSFKKNMSGGVLRKNITSFKDEIDAKTGKFQVPSTAGSIVQTISNMRIVGFKGNYSYTDGGCGVPMVVPMVEGKCAMWGNPIAEMMYEGLRYIAGKKTPTSVYNFTDEFSVFESDDRLVLPKPDWSDPYRTDGGYPYCSRPFELVIADAPSFDTDQLPGTAFGNGISSDIGNLDVAGIGQFIWNNEEGGTKKIFIGQSGTDYDTAPTLKDVSSFGNIRGLAPEEPTREGGYYAGSVAYFGKTAGVRKINIGSDEHTVRTDTFGVSLSSPLPTIVIPVPESDKNITLVPFAKSLGYGINPSRKQFQPTNTIVDFFVEKIVNTGEKNKDISVNNGLPYIQFRINYEDSEYGSDHDMDAIVIYTIRFDKQGNQYHLEVELKPEYEAGSVLHHIGYVISGTTADGLYLEVRDWNYLANDGNPFADISYFLDTPAAFLGTPPAPDSGSGTWNDGISLPSNDTKIATRSFTPSNEAVSASFIKHDPLWYASKWGGFIDSNKNNQLDESEWDKDNDGRPDSYFLVTNAEKLLEQLSNTFEEMTSRTSATASVTLNSTVLRNESTIYQARFNSGDWTGELQAFSLDQITGSIDSQIWNAQDQLRQQNFNTGRKILTFKPSAKKGVPFRWPTTIPSDPDEQTDSTSIDRDQIDALKGADGNGEARLKYLRGDAANEDPSGKKYRKRTTGTTRNILGDIINSTPFYVGKPIAGYIFGDYFEFANREAIKNRRSMIYVGANDGMLHAFDASATTQAGTEVFAYIPSKLFSELNTLTERTYKNPEHKFYVDGTPTVADVQFSDASWHTVLVGGLRAGGKSYFALDVTNPDLVTEAGAGSIVLWEFTDDDDKDLGLTFSQPSLVRLGDSDSDAGNNPWVVVFGNGYNSINPNKSITDPVTPKTTAVLFVLNVQTGEIVRKFDLLEGQGLATPSVVDGNNDGIADFIYAGDLEGNIWRFDIRDANPDDWTYAKLFTAKDVNGKVQPITSAPQVAINPKRNTSTDPNTELDELTYMVLFGTGQYLTAADITNRDQQTFYGVWDDMDGGSCPPITTITFPVTPCFTRLNLQAQIYCRLGNPDGEPTCQAGSGTDLTTSSGEFTQDGQTYRITSSRCVEYGDLPEEKQCPTDPVTNQSLSQKHGWYLDLKSSGERVPGDPLILGSRVIFTSILPDSDPCAYGGKSWLNLLKSVSGQRIDSGTFLSKASGSPVAESGATPDAKGTGFAPSSVEIDSISSAPSAMKAPDQGKSIIYLNTAAGNTEFFPIKDTEIGRQSWRQLEFQ